jgi:amino acid transporter
VALYLAQTLSVPFYILGFTEALVRTFPLLTTGFLYINFGILLILFAITFRGAGWAIKTQYFIMALLGLSIFSFMGGGMLKFDRSVLNANLTPFTNSPYSFWQLFAIYFPAVTGIMAGVNMSGDLKKPSRSIPLGTFAAIGTALLIYAGQIVICGGSISREQLIEKPYHSLIDLVPFHLGFLVTLGVFAATLSSALGSLLGAPRILQSLAADHLLKPLNLFSKVARDGEPRRALLLTAGISALVFYFARNGGSGGALNIVASIVTMLFLWTYGITNLAAFVESFSRNPSFRPRFKLFHWFLALTGAVLSFVASVLVDAPAALGAVVFVALLFLYVRKFAGVSLFADARHGFFYSRTRNNLCTLAQMPVHPKNWRPTIIAFAGNPQTRLPLVQYADWLGSGRGIVTLAGIITGTYEEKVKEREAYLAELSSFIKSNHIRAFPEVLVTPEFSLGLNHFLQVTSIGPVKPNLVLMGWARDEERIQTLHQSLLTAHQLNMSTVLLCNRELPEKKKHRRIDIWWRGKSNGSLMVILAYLLSLNRSWGGTALRILRVIPDTSGHAATHSEMSNLIEASRMKIAMEIIISREPFTDLLHSHSQDATAVFIGFSLPTADTAVSFHRSMSALLYGMPTTLLVHSTGEADLVS